MQTPQLKPKIRNLPENITNKNMSRTFVESVKILLWLKFNNSAAEPIKKPFAIKLPKMRIYRMHICVYGIWYICHICMFIYVAFTKLLTAMQIKFTVHFYEFAFLVTSHFIKAHESIKNILKNSLNINTLYIGR